MRVILGDIERLVPLAARADRLLLAKFRDTAEKLVGLGEKLPDAEQWQGEIDEAGANADYGWSPFARANLAGRSAGASSSALRE
ncbi:hypothetical protein [Qipengyuania xiamenensis]|uniref:hypothetical protein n=1 Tax=Qipengyuania xiamenensis TaxID=2867237 RepID=UPI001FFCCC2B|nr:hypothetical protein [Qipengyuania xiamenensis]